MKRNVILKNCNLLLDVFKAGKLGYMKMPEDAHPDFKGDVESRLLYFTLPMGLNYQRDSYKLWEAALKTYDDPQTRKVFDLQFLKTADEETIRTLLTKYKVALQPNKHVSTWTRIARTILNNWGSISNLFAAAEYDFLKLQDIIQNTHKKEFPYLSGPKIFHYWSFIMQSYGNVKLQNAEYIQIAPDTHVTKCSVLLGVITETEALTLDKDTLSQRWRVVLEGSGINPIDMHSPLWFWSRNGFSFKL